MLTGIHLNNFVLAEALTIDCDNGLSVITGETGAGKSIWIDAIGFALGQRANTHLIRHGTERCCVTLSFNIEGNNACQQWLKSHELFFEDTECIIKRTLTTDGRSKALINGQPCPLHLIRQCSEYLLIIHSQHQHHALLKSDYQRLQIDHYAANHAISEQVQQLYQQWNNIQQEKQAIMEQTAAKSSDLALYQYQYDELQALQLQPDEWQQLTKEHQQCHHAKSLLQDLNHAINCTSNHQDHSAETLTQQAIEHLKHCAKTDDRLNATVTLLETAAIHLQEASAELNHYQQQVNVNPEHLETLERRLNKIHDLARKHHTTPEHLPHIISSLHEKITTLEHSDIKLQTLNSTLEKLEKKYHTAANKLSKSRLAACKALSQQLTLSLHQLAMKDAQLKINCKTTVNSLSPHGHDTIEFLIQTNAGTPLQPMQNTTSGGELSRISLALQLINAEQLSPPTLIFDEVDVGIGGKTAALIGSHLQQLGEKTQVLCITHLPQVASQGHHHYHVKKSTTDQSTSSIIKKLTQTERVEEIARMIGGKTITAKTKAHAKELLQNT